MRFVVLKAVNGHVETYHASGSGMALETFTTQDAAEKAAEALAKQDAGAAFGVYGRLVAFGTVHEIRRVEEIQ